MENKLKVGQTFEVVEVLTDGGFGIDAFKIGGITVGTNHGLLHGFHVLSNSNNNYSLMLYMAKNEIKPIGKITITKVK